MNQPKPQRRLTKRSLASLLRLAWLRLRRRLVTLVMDDDCRWTVE
jgi:hypothetical protein